MKIIKLLICFFVFMFFQLSNAEVKLPKKKVMFEAVVYHHGGPEKYELFEHGENGYLVFYENNIKKYQKIYSFKLAQRFLKNRIIPVLTEVQKKKKTNNLALCSVRVDSMWKTEKEYQSSSYCLGDESGNTLSPLLHQMHRLIKQ